MPPFLRVLELSTCWNSSKMRAWSSGAMPRPVSVTVDHEAAVLDLRPDADRARVGELDRVADQVQQHLGDPALVAAAGAADRPRASTSSASCFSAASASVALTTSSTSSRIE